MAIDPPLSSLTAQALGKRYNREWIFKNLSYTFTAGKTYAITGPNGSGKSTLLQVLWGQVPPSSGDLHYAIYGVPKPVEEIYEQVSIATPYLDLIDELTLQEMIHFHFKMRSIRDDLSVNDVLQLLELEHAKDKSIQAFSSGMRQRLKLGLAFFTKAAYIFLDEPFTNLDTNAIQWCQQQLEGVRQSLVFIASNDPREYEMADSCLRLSDFK